MAITELNASGELLQPIDERLAHLEGLLPREHAELIAEARDRLKSQGEALLCEFASVSPPEIEGRPSVEFHDIYRAVIENLDNAIDNGFAHDFTRTTRQILLEMIEQGALEEEMTARDIYIGQTAVTHWRWMKSI